VRNPVFSQSLRGVIINEIGKLILAMYSQPEHPEKGETAKCLEVRIWGGFVRFAGVGGHGFGDVLGIP